jgi:hypothetical protein
MTVLSDLELPVLVEVRFPGMATSPDWYFCREEEELEAIRSRLGPGAEVHLHSVWDLTDPTGGVVIGK